MSESLKRIVNDDVQPAPCNPLYQEILRRARSLLKKTPDTESIPDGCYNKRINARLDGYDVLVQGSRRGDVGISVSPPSSEKWIVSFNHTIGLRSVLNEDLVSGVVLPALRRLMVLDDLASV